MVYVLNVNGQPLMPTNRRGKVKWLLRQGRAKVVRRCPFTIQLLYETGNHTQPVTLGVDAGSKVIGLSATTQAKELYAAEVQLRTDVVELLSARRAFRAARRNRTTRYRKPRFDNRRKPSGWLAPSIRQKINTHIQAVKQVHRILPITKIIVEVAAFDIQKIKNPDISGAQYQQGEQSGFWNIREYVLWRDGHACQGRKGCKEQVLNVHHIESRMTGGNAPNNLITLCERCHNDYHKGVLKLNLKRGQSLRDAAFMGITRWAVYGELIEIYQDVKLTYGYITKNARIANGLTKTHAVDARCVSGNATVSASNDVYYQKAARKRNRQIHKATILMGGYRKLNQAPKYVYGYQLFDKVLYNSEVGFVFGRRSSGSFDIRKLDGEKLTAGVSYKKLKLLEARKSILTEVKARSSPAYALASRAR